MKAIRSVELGIFTLEQEVYKDFSVDMLKEKLKDIDIDRLFVLAEALRKGITVQEINEITKIDEFFINKFKQIVLMEEVLKKLKITDLTYEIMLKAKKMGFVDTVIAKYTNCKTEEIKNKRKDLKINCTFKMVDTCAAEFEAVTPYFYSTYDTYCESIQTNNKKVLVLGSGPIRIGQGIEFDYCSVHSAWALREEGYETIIINNNPETVSTDFDTSDRLYFEPLTPEDVENVINIEKPYGAIVQFGGQTAIKLAKTLDNLGVKYLELLRNI